MSCLCIDLTGGSAVWRIAAYSYLSDITEPEMRTKRIAFCDGMFLMGFYIGNMLGGPVKKYLGYGYNFSFGMLCSILAVAWCILFVKDSKAQRDAKLAKELGLHDVDIHKSTITKLRRMSSVKAKKEMALAKQESSDGMCSNCYGLFRISSITEGFSTVFKRREGNRRMYVIITIIAITVDVFAARGRWQSLFLYFRKVLNWSITQYSTYMSTLGLTGAIGSYILVPFLSRKVLLHDATISIIDTATSVIRYEKYGGHRLCNDFLNY